MPVSSKNKILIVDDEIDIREELGLYLDKKGYDIITAEDGTAALRLFQIEKPILVITDFKMPRMNGIDLLKEIKRINRDIHVILVSGAADRAIVVSALKEEAYDFLLKPIDLNELSRVVHIAIIKTKSVLLEQPRIHQAEEFFRHELRNTPVEVSILHFNQDLDEYSAGKYEKSYKDLFLNGELKQNIIIDMGKVSYINNRGVDFLLAMKEQSEKRGFTIYLCDLTEHVDHYLASLGYRERFTIGKNCDIILKRLS